MTNWRNQDHKYTNISTLECLTDKLVLSHSRSPIHSWPEKSLDEQLLQLWVHHLRAAKVRLIAVQYLKPKWSTGPTIFLALRRSLVRIRAHWEFLSWHHLFTVCRWTARQNFARGMPETTAGEIRECCTRFTLIIEGKSRGRKEVCCHHKPSRKLGAKSVKQK